MGLLSGLFTFPLAPVRGVQWLSERLEGEARRQLNDPVAVRQHLEDVDSAYQAGELTESERDELQDELVSRLLPPPRTGT